MRQQVEGVESQRLDAFDLSSAGPTLGSIPPPL
jgi:hypothetical protein